MTLQWPWGNSLMKPNLNPYVTCVLVLGWDSLGVIMQVLATSPNKSTYLFLVHSRNFREGWDKGDLIRYYPFNPYITPFQHLGYVRCTLVLVSGLVLTIILILNVQNWGKKHKNKLFSPLLSWFDLAVTLRWPYNDLGVTASWRPILIHMSPVYLGWDSLGVMQVLATSLNKSIYLLFGPFPSFQRKVT